MKRNEDERRAADRRLAKARPTSSLSAVTGIEAVKRVAAVTIEDLTQEQGKKLQLSNADRVGWGHNLVTGFHRRRDWVGVKVG